MGNKGLANTVGMTTHRVGDPLHKFQKFFSHLLT